MMTAKLYGGAVSIHLDSPIDKPGKVCLEGPPAMVTEAEHALRFAHGFQGHSLDHPEPATPRDLHAALIGLKRALRVTDLMIDDYSPLPELPPGCVY